MTNEPLPICVKLLRRDKFGTPHNPSGPKAAAIIEGLVGAGSALIDGWHNPPSLRQMNLRVEAFEAALEAAGVPKL